MRIKTEKYVIIKDGKTLPERSKLKFDNMADFICGLEGAKKSDLQWLVDTHEEIGIADTREEFLKKYFAEEYEIFEANYKATRSEKAKEAKKQRKKKALEKRFANLLDD